MIEKFISNSPEDTEKFAARFAERLRGGDIVAFFGGLGAGKTCFVRGLAEGLGINPRDVSSPTFAIVNVYDDKLAHFDMYRISPGEEIESTGFYDYEDIIRAVEWAENITENLPLNIYKVTIKEKSENVREIIIENE
jgi:tRNA threonylcarbamoyladenosine biosynthesis protein TsaE